MESIIEVVVAIGPRLAKCIFGHIESHYTSKVANLRDQVGELNIATQNMRDRVAVAVGNGEVIHDEVQHWLESATEISRRAEGFLNVNPDRANVSCCSVQIPNLSSRRKLSREAGQMVEDLLCKIQAGRQFVVIAYRPALQTVIAMRGDYEDFGSRKMIVEDIMKALQDRNVSRIGIYGIGGIGKTTLAKEVARKVVEAKLFTQVAMTTVSQPPDLSRMQMEIAEKIGLNIKGLESITARADRLQRRLKEERSVLIILDDIWEKLDLIEVGIHLENEGCKMLMTSRDQGVLVSMDAVEKFPVDDLSAGEAMSLFRKIVGDIVEKTDFVRLAADVVRECGHLPLAITTVAYALKRQDNLSVWSDALMRLRNFAPTNTDVVRKNIYKSIKLSYEFLRSAEEKSLLLLCSLFGENRNITVEDLIMCSVGLDLFRNVHTLADLRTRVEALIVRLKACCLLLDGDRGDGVKMHDVIRDVALSIASEVRDMHGVILKKEEDCRKIEKLKDSKVLSLLPYSDFNQLPERLECSELELFLLLSYQRNCLPIPNHLLDQSKDRLRSLFFERANLVSVPPSFHSLQNLQTLRLRGCVLEDVNFIGDLKNLQILDLSESTIKQLPIKVAQLSHLQLLNLEGCTDLKLIEPNVISSLTQLEELCIAEEFDKWEVGEVNVSSRSNVNLAEIENLQKLTSSSLRVPDAKTFPKDFKFSKNLERYRISIGGPLLYGHSTGISRSLLLKLRERSQLTALGLESLMKRSECLSLDGLIDVKNVVYDLDSEGFSNLKRLDLKNSDGIKYIVDCVDQQIHPHKAFLVLDSLRLEGLRNLERICHGMLPEDSFKNLWDVTVLSCDKLKNVFPSSIFKRLHSIQVNNCKMMEEIVGHVRSEDDGAVEFPELRSLRLGNLPKIVKFMSWSEAEAAGGSSSVESPDPFFGEELEFPGLERLDLNGLNAVESVWTTCYMDNLTSLSVRNCKSLKYLFSLAVAERLVKLKKLRVENCEVMEHIVVTNNLGEEGRSGNKILFPQLESLTLSKLSVLRKFCHEEVILPKLESLSTDWSEAITEMLGTSQSSSTLSLCHRQLKELNLNFSHQDKPFALSICKLLQRCHNLEKLHLNGFSVHVICKDQQNEVGVAAQEYRQLITRLKVLRLYNVPKLRHLFVEPENAHPVGGALQPAKTTIVSFQNLTILVVSFCHRLKYLLASSTATSLEQLKEMRVTDCNRMTEIITDYREGEITEGEHDREFVFPQLEILVLCHLPNLGSFFSGNNVMRFPKLKKFFVSQCPKMRSFSHGIIISSLMLNTIITETDFERIEYRSTNYLMKHAKAVRELWDGDVNTTLRQLWEDDSNWALQQLLSEEDVHASGEGTSSLATRL